MNSAERSRQLWRDIDPLPWVIAVLLALGQLRHQILFFNANIGRSVQAAEGVLEGLPHWRVFQSRLLGPELVGLLSSAGGLSFLNAHLVVSTVAMVLSGVLAFRVAGWLGGRAAGWGGLLSLHVLFALLMTAPWLYIWDYFVLLLGLLFLHLVVHRAPWWALLAVMALCFLNHESAQFCAVWMVAQGLADNWRLHRADWRRWRWEMSVSGLLGGLGGLAVTELLRSALLIREVGPEIFNDVAMATIGPHVHIKLSENIGEIVTWFTVPDYGLSFLIPLLPLTALVAAGVLLHRHGLAALGLFAYVLAQVVALALFTVLPETRVLLQLVPFLVVAPALLSNGRWAEAREPAPVPPESGACPASAA
jgi:hypothetical protein